MASIAENLRATLLSLKQISDRVKSLILTSVTKSELNSAKQEVLDAIDEIDIDTSDLAKEATLGDVQDVLEYIEQGGMPKISAIAKQGTNPNATLSEVQAQATNAASDAAAAKTAAQGITGYALQGSDTTATNTALAALIGYTISEIDGI